MSDWTIPRTWTAVTVVGAADLNTQMRDNLNALKSPPFQQVVTAYSETISATASTAIPITGDLAITLSTNGGAIHFYFQGRIRGFNATAVLNVDYNGTAWVDTPSGIRYVDNVAQMVNFQGWITGLPSGTHVFTPTWLVPGGGQARLFCSSEPAVFIAREIS